MPNQASTDLSERLLRIAASAADGVGKARFVAALKGKASPRTISRRLAELVEARQLRTEGKARALRYFLVAGTGTSANVLPALQVSGESESYVPISDEARAIRDYIRKPITDRRPVGYKRQLLEDYQPNETWYLSGDLRKRLLDLGRSSSIERPAGTYARDILNRLLIDLSWASSRLEGNTYTRLETQALIEFGRAAEGKDQNEAQMILNHKAAIEMLVEGADQIGFNAFTFKNLHANLAENLLADPAMSGRLRTRIVDVHGTVFHPLSIPQQIEEYFGLILRKADAIQDPFEQSFFVMVHIPYLQPFIDVNKRVSRLGANISLIKHNLCPLSFIDVPERAYVEGTLGVYELNQVDLLRDVFAWAYERSCQRFLAIQESVAAPDPVRLRNRDVLSAVIADIVRGGQPISAEIVQKAASGRVNAADMDRFVEIAIQELKNLHEGNVARFRLKLGEYEAWRTLQGGS